MQQDTTTGVIVERFGETLKVTTPFHPNLPPYARRLRGRWDPEVKAWAFSTRDEMQVREMLLSIFGTDGSTTAPEGLIRLRRVMLVEAARAALTALTPDERAAVLEEFRGAAGSPKC